MIDKYLNLGGLEQFYNNIKEIDYKIIASSLNDLNNKISTINNVPSATKLQNSRTIWGKPFDGTSNIIGDLSSVSNINMSGSINGASYIELYGKNSNTSTRIPYIDFHFLGNTSDYTSRIQEISSGTLNIPGNLSIGTNLTVDGNITTDNTISGFLLESTITNDAPFIINSDSLVENLNSNYLDGYLESDFLHLTGGNMSGNISFNTNRGIKLLDSTGTAYDAFHDNTANLWIGALQKTARHHVGGTVISTGWNKTTKTGNPTVNIVIPNDSNTDGTTYGLLHTGSGVTLSTEQTIQSLKTWTSRQNLQKGFITSIGNSTSASITASNYIKRAVITITASYCNEPIEITFSKRGLTLLTTVTIKFKSLNSVDPDLESFILQGTNHNIYLAKTDTSTWSLYVKTDETYLNISVLDIKWGSYALSKLNIEWTYDVVTELPENYISATPKTWWGAEVKSSTRINLDHSLIITNGNNKSFGIEGTSPEGDSNKYYIKLNMGNGINRGLYDNGTANKWLLYFDSNNTIINYGNAVITNSLSLPNSKSILAKDSSGTERGLILLSASDHLFIGMGIPTLSGGTYIYGGSQGINFRPAGNTTKMLINSSGYVGIGQASPTVLLDVSGSIRAAGSNPFIRTLNTSNNKGVQLYSYTTNNRRGLYDVSPANWIIGCDDNHTFLPKGNVLIGTPSSSIPDYKLKVDGTTAATSFINTNSSNDFVLLGGGGTHLYWITIDDLVTSHVFTCWYHSGGFEIVVPTMLSSVNEFITAIQNNNNKILIAYSDDALIICGDSSGFDTGDGFVDFSDLYIDDVTDHCTILWVDL